MRKIDQLYTVFPANGCSERYYNLDGVLGTNEYRDDEVVNYLQLFRNGCYEFVDRYVFWRPQESKDGFVSSESLVTHAVEAMTRLFRLCQQMGISAPIVVFATLVDVKGYILSTRSNVFTESRKKRYTFRHNAYHIPEITVNDLADDVPLLLKPILDMLWNAAGMARCEFYDNNGNYFEKKHQQ